PAGGGAGGARAVAVRAAGAAAGSLGCGWSEIGPPLRAADAVAAFGAAGAVAAFGAAGAAAGRGAAAGWLLTGLPLASDASGRMTTVRIFLGSVDVLAPCPGVTGAGSTTRGAAWVPRSLSATGSSCFDTICSLSAFADRSCATLTDCGSPAPAGTIFVCVGVLAVVAGRA